MALSTDDAARLAKLKAAYDALISGKQVVRVEFNGHVTHYGQGSVAALQAEVAGLEAKASCSGRVRGSLRFRVGR